MKRSDISDAQIVAACKAYHDDLKATGGNAGRGISIVRLMLSAGAPEKVARAAMERACRRGLVGVGMGIDWAWPTDEGLALL